MAASDLDDPITKLTDLKSRWDSLSPTAREDKIQDILDNIDLIDTES